MKKYILIISAAIILVSFCFGTWFVFGAKNNYYYTQIDNGKMEENEKREGVIDFKGGMPYLYTLDSYDKNGQEEIVTFGSSKKLKEGAFLKLNIAPIRGVTSWEEVKYNDLPPAVKEKYPQPSH